MTDRSIPGGLARPSRRGFLAGAAGVAALAAAACSAPSDSAPTVTTPTDGFMPDANGNVTPDFDTVNAGGRLGWAGVAERMSYRPARIAGLAEHGRPLAVGEPANLTLVDPAARWRDRRSGPAPHAQLNE